MDKSDKMNVKKTQKSTKLSECHLLSYFFMRKPYFLRKVFIVSRSIICSVMFY